MSSRRTLPKLIEDLRAYQADLEARNTALEYSRLAAEGASERFESLFSNVPLALMVVDEDGMIEQSNTMALKLFRPLEADPPLTYLQPLVTSNHVKRVQQALDAARLHGQSGATEVVFLSGLQSRFTGDLHIARIRYSSDTDMSHFVCAVIDQGPLLNERRALLEGRRALQESAQALRKRNEELLLSENRLAAVINSSLDAIVCVDDAQCITVFNPAASALFQCPPEQALGASLAHFLPDAIEAIASTLVSTQAILGEVNGRTAAGLPLTLEVSVSRERQSDGQGDITTIFARDLTARRQVEAQRNVLEVQLREAHKMQAIGTMAGGIAHDFNNILSAILGNVMLARQDLPPDASAQVSLAEIEKAGRRGRDLVRQILTFSRNEPPRRRPLHLAEVVQESMRLMKVTLPPAVDLQLNLLETPPVLADATQVEQALINLCTNAVHALGGAPGVVNITLTSVTPDKRECQRLGLSAGRYVILAVRDTGSGMDAETVQRIFEPFFTTKPVGQGTGLGLAVVHGVMRSHLGAVDVKSRLGEGSEFTLYFPAASSQATVTAAEPARLQTVMGFGQHVMYVDDDQALAFLVDRVLSRRGFKISVFTDPLTALAALREQPQAYDLLITDYNMPGYSGVSLLQEARRIRPKLPMALTSGYVTPEIEVQAMAAGARALILKPNDVSELCDTVQRLIQGVQGQGAASGGQRH
ncbi:PAS domain-containing hybrid sensor histidine kinase/response regulator [Hylemonella gracilis]|uniref:histidine kinase n=1 Tax=Hylemonella gracilis ATCC 19624 TaxID=887062 RepID=F3KVB2_9BURK|nr:PAS domain-containing sensor histidine kinase [Hylemonella gracilis]EGI76282.1 PAS/PAC sensor hybrid histidine kinase [Hylemonella gracilis ATCC 19624]